MVERYDYGDFGEPEFYTAGGTTRTESALDNPYLFTGRRYDPESQFYYYRNRYFDPRVGQFTTRDPIGIWGDPLNLGNPYAYVGNSPWSLVDPWGLCASDEFDARKAALLKLVEMGLVGLPMTDITTVGTGSGSHPLLDGLYPTLAAVNDLLESLSQSNLASKSFGLLGTSNLDQARLLEHEYRGITAATWASDMTWQGALMLMPLAPAATSGIKGWFGSGSRVGGQRFIPHARPALANTGGFGDLSIASKYSAQAYNKLRGALKGTGNFAHHLYEKRFAQFFGKAGEMQSIALTRAEHQAFTNAWRKAIPYGKGTATATKERVVNVARGIYEHYPAILRALGLQ